jgi:hypothetical protein
VASHSEVEKFRLIERGELCRTGVASRNASSKDRFERMVELRREVFPRFIIVSGKIGKSGVRCRRKNFGSKLGMSRPRFCPSVAFCVQPGFL